MPTRSSARLGLSLLALVAAAAALPAAASAQAAKPAPKAADVERAKASFDAFASEWMERMQRLEQDNRASPKLEGGAASYLGYGDDFRVEIRPTGYAPAPFVGVLRYEEHNFSCSDLAATLCRIRSRLPVTELFRYQDGRWVY